MIPRFPVYLFDIDGTLLDSARDICPAVQHAVSQEGAPEFPFEYLRGFIGQNLKAVFSDVFPECDSIRIQRLTDFYRTAYHGRKHQSTQPYPGVKEALSRLGGRKSTATTKGSPMARAVLEQFELLPYFKHVQGTDGFNCKPSPDVIHAALRALGAEAPDCLMVGDAPADVQAARAAGVKVCAVRYGYGKIEDLAREAPDYWISDLRELL